MRERKPTIDRRTALAGAGTAGALATAAALLPTGQTSAPTESVARTEPAGEGASGYRLTEHIKRYYASARI
jgi:hypothetical protein